MLKKISYLLGSAGVAAIAFGMVASATAQDAGRQDGAQDQQAVEAGGTTAELPSEKSFTKPSEERALAFSAPGLVSKVVVKDGERVKKDQLLAEQDITVEKANQATYLIEANSAVEEEFAKADFDLKKVELQRKEDLFKKKNSTFLEVEEARLNVKRAEASVQLATQKRQTAAAQAAVEQAKIDLKRIVSPIDGVISKLDTHAGEVAANESNKPAIRVVRNDPLWVDVNIAAAQAAKLKEGQTLQVRYVAEDKWMPAQVLFLQSMINRGSQTRTVRLEMPNPDERPAGLEVFVRLPDAVAAARADARK